MWTKGVLILGLIVCWTAVCKGEDGYLDDYETGDVTSNELAEDYLFREEGKEEVECKDDRDCSVRQKCVEDDEKMLCKCADGLGGENCKDRIWCEDPEKFKNCNAENGEECEYDDNKRSVVCACGSGKQWHPTEKICKECDCGNKGVCSLDTGEKVCTCQPGHIEKNGKCEECDCGNKGTCSLDTGEKVCTCQPGHIEKNGKCEECDCGPKGSCELKDGEKICKCEEGFAVNDGKCKKTCVEGDCEHKTECEQFEEHTFCKCTQGLSGDKCEIVDECETGDFKKCKPENGTCEYDDEIKKAVCTCPDKKELDSVLKYCIECDCGENGKCSVVKGEKSCKCDPKFALKNGKCEECDCGDNGTCSFDNGNKKCVCSEGYLEYNGVCKECDCGKNGKCDFKNGEKNCTCVKTFVVKEKDGKCHECDCGTGGICSFNEDDKKECTCKKGFKEYNKMCKECDCGQNGDCEFDDKGKKTCKCSVGFTVKKVGNKETCAQICENTDDCKNGGECKAGKKDGGNVCFCKHGFEGETCEKFSVCVTGKYSRCEETGGECKIDGTKITCVCKLATQTLDESLDKPICKEKCSKNDDCQNGGTCDTTTNLCKCKKNTSGDKCDVVSGCDLLKCESKDAKCIYDTNKEMVTCKCNDNKYYFENGKCNPEWCKTGCKDAFSTCEYKDGVGICNCKDTESYYDYAIESCKKIDSCFNKTCENNQICSNGQCVCPENHKENGTGCEPLDLCNPNKLCFPDAQCEKGSAFGYVKCLCNPDSKFYRPGLKKCDDGVCFLNVERKNCKKSCPYGMDRKDGTCEHRDAEKKCDEDCGFLGWCKKVNATVHECLCDPSYAEKDKKTNKCVLKATAVCPTKEKDGDNKCKCTGKYKQAANGITCELKSCSDEDVQNECKNKRAPKCVDNWKNDVGYKCLCPVGYIDDKDKGCIDPCSQDIAKDKCSSKGQICFLGQKLKIEDCRCPPTFIYNENTKSCDIGGVNTFMIHNLPILSKKYETVENDINKVLLNIDVSTSMMQAFRNLEFAHVLNFKVNKAVLICDVWLQFKATLPDKFDASAEVKRWEHQLREINEQLILLPGLFLSSDHFAEAKVEELTLCTPSVQQSVCGTGSTCANNTCFCDTGFKEIESTIKQSGNKRIVRCEDIDECKEGKHDCKENSECVNTLGDYFCKCKPGFKKEKGDANAIDKAACIGLCDAKPCGKGTCELTKENTVDCKCQRGYTGSFCNRKDEDLAKAGKATKVVGAVLGTLLAIVIILIIVYIVRQRKNSYSEDFTPAPRVDNAEMVERRPMRGVTNRAYQ